MRLLHQDVDVLLLDEPTRGIDVGSQSRYLSGCIGELAAQGKSVLLVAATCPSSWACATGSR